MDLSKSSEIENLADANHIAKVEGGIEKQFKGLEYGGELAMTCMNCDKLVAILMKISANPTRYPIGGGKYAYVETQRFQANCPFCENKTWIIKTDGQVMVGGADNSERSYRDTVYTGCKFGDVEDPEGMFNEIEIG